jgi:ribosomal protein S27AE
MNAPSLYLYRTELYNVWKNSTDSVTLEFEMWLIDRLVNGLKENDRYREALEEIADYPKAGAANYPVKIATAALHPLVKPERKCPNCGSTKIIMFTSDDDTCQNCHKILPGE